MSRILGARQQIWRLHRSGQQNGLPECVCDHRRPICQRKEDQELQDEQELHTCNLQQHLQVKRFVTRQRGNPNWSKLHFHTPKHSICVLLWQATHDLNAIQDHVGHRSSSSTLVYLRADAAQKAQTTIAGMSLGGSM
jgi:integrase